MNKNTKKILKEYKIKAPLYKEFASAINSLLRSMLKGAGYKYHINYRLKDTQSLEEKIERKKIKGKVYEKLKDIKDIAGVRIIFYTDNDRKKFISKIQKEFKDSLKIERTEKMSGYKAVHGVVSFGEERLKLNEYKIFRGLECEVQLSLILEHAWAEIEHDILYKENWGFKQLKSVHYLFMKERMERIMRNHINRASTELERVVLQFKNIKRVNLAKYEERDKQREY